MRSCLTCAHGKHYRRYEQMGDYGIKQLLAGAALVAGALGTLLMGASAQDEDGSERPQVQFVTPMGTFVIELYPEESPITVENVLKYTAAGFYTSTIFPRIIPGFVIQGGGFDGMLEGSLRKRVIADLDNSAIRNEAANGLQNLKYTLSMARTSEPDSATSQFFINLRDNANLDYLKDQSAGYAVFGKVIAGQDVIDRMGRVATKNHGRYADVPEDEIKVTRANQLQGEQRVEAP